MAKYHVGEFAMGGAGSQSIVGVGFKPRLVYIFANRLIDGEETLAQSHFEFGAADQDGNQWGLSVASQDAVTISQSGRISSASSFIIVPDGANTPRTIGAEAQLTSMDDDGFTINVSNAPPRAYGISYLAIGGDDLVVKVGNFQAPGLGAQSITGVGFQPDSLLAAGIFVTGATANNDHSSIGIGWADRNLSQAAVAAQAQDALGDSNTNRRQSITKNLTVLSASGTTFLSMETTSYDEDGFSVNFTDTTPNNSFIFYVATKGIQTKVGAFNTFTSVGNHEVRGVGFRPGAALFGSFVNPNTGSTVAGAKMSFGAASGNDNQGYRGFTDEDAQGVTDADQFRYTDAFYRAYDYTRTLLGEARIESWDSDGFTFEQVDADSAANEIIFIAFEDAPDNNPPPEIITARSFSSILPSSASPDGKYNPPIQQLMKKVAQINRVVESGFSGHSEFTTFGSNTFSLTGNVNNFAVGSNTLWWLKPTANRNLGGFDGGEEGRVLVIVNIDSTFNVTIINNNAATHAMNRITTHTAGNIVLAPNDGALLVYNEVESRWRMILSS